MTVREIRRSRNPRILCSLPAGGRNDQCPAAAYIAKVQEWLGHANNECLVVGLTYDSSLLQKKGRGERFWRRKEREA
jgi:hypothetical protein